MRNTLIIAKREIKSFFTSPLAYIVLIGFLLLAGWFFSNSLFLINQADLRMLFSNIPMIFIIFIPAIAMGLISKEKNTGTIELLTTLPIEDHHIVLGKFLAALFLIAVGLLFTLVHLVTISILGSGVDYGQIIGAYVGLLLLGAVYSAIGVFTSSLTRNQIVAFLVSFVIIFAFYILDKVLLFIPGSLQGFFQYISTSYHFSNIERGVVDTRNLVYFGCIIFMFLYASLLVFKSRKW